MMKSILSLCVLLSICISSCMGKDLIVGTSYNTHLIWQEKVEYAGIPFKKRVKEVFFSNPSQQVIKCVIAREVENTDASAIITAGGVDFSYVNIRFKSERGSGIHYQLELYV